MRNIFKEFDSAQRIRLLMIFLTFTFTAYLFVGSYVISSLIAMPPTILSLFLIEKLGSIIGNLLSGWTSGTHDPKGAVVADLEKVRAYRRKGEFEEALSTIDRVITTMPNLPDALYLKAQVLCEGFKKHSEAKKFLGKAMALTSNDETIHQWASSYYDDIVRIEKEIVISKS